MYVSPATANHLDGLNIFKAIGRALGSTGRAIVGTVVPGVASVLDTAARQPSDKQIAASIAAAAPATPATPTATTTDPTMAAMLQQMLANQQAQIAAQQMQPQYQQPIYSPSQVPQQAPQSMPPWLIPAALGGVGLLLVLSRK